MYSSGQIKNSAFANCTSLSEVYCYSYEPLKLGADAFNANSSNRKIYVRSSSAVSSYKIADGWSQYASAIEYKSASSFN